MKCITSLVLALVLSTMVFAQNNTEASELTPNGPYIQFTEKSHDFGDITQGDKVKYVFEFTNTGNAPVIMSNVQTTCGCTAPSWPREPILPGKSGEIAVVFNSSGKVGHQNKVITIMSNATNNPERIKIVTNVLPPSDKS